MKINRCDNVAFKQKYYLPQVKDPFNGAILFEKLRKFCYAAQEHDCTKFFLDSEKKYFVATGKDANALNNFLFLQDKKLGVSSFFSDAVEFGEKDFCDLQAPLIDVNKDYKVNFLHGETWRKPFTVLNDYLNALGIKTSYGMHHNTHSGYVYFPVKSADDYNQSFNKLKNSDMSVKDFNESEKALMNPLAEEFDINAAQKLIMALRNKLKLQ